jgi:hypothetical protein
MHTPRELRLLVAKLSLAKKGDFMLRAPSKNYEWQVAMTDANPKEH